jgi:hypothetical protein
VWCCKDDTHLHLWDDTIGTFRLQTEAPNGRIIEHMPSTLTTHEQLAIPQRLRLRPARTQKRARPVLFAGANAARRAAALSEIDGALPEHTPIEEASAFWEVLALAPACRTVFVTGDLEDGAAEALTRTLRRRHPELPVVSLKSDAPA